MPGTIETTAIDWDYFRVNGVGFSGAVKLQQPPGGSCCDCNGSDNSTIAIFENGTAIDLWACQGCRCQQSPITSIVVPTGSGMAIIPGATLPEEVCSMTCYTKRLAAGEGGFSGAWEQSDPIRQAAIDAVALKLMLIDSRKAQAATKKQLDSCINAAAVKTPQAKPKPADPIETFIRSLSC